MARIKAFAYDCNIVVFIFAYNFKFVFKICLMKGNYKKYFLYILRNSIGLCLVP